MLLSLAGALGLTLLATPKTSGVYVAAQRAPVRLTAELPPRGRP